MMIYRPTSIGVVYKSKSWSDVWLEEFRKQVREDAIDRVHKSRNDGFFVALKDGTTIRAVRFNYDSVRGMKFDRLILEPTIIASDEKDKYQLDLFVATILRSIEYAYGA